MDFESLKDCINQGKNFFQCILDWKGEGFLKECGFRDEDIIKIQNDEMGIFMCPLLQAMVNVFDRLNIPLSVVKGVLKNEKDPMPGFGTSKAGTISMIYDELVRRGRRNLTTC